LILLLYKQKNAVPDLKPETASKERKFATCPHGA
jgi:hypothetical protein